VQTWGSRAACRGIRFLISTNLLLLSSALFSYSLLFFFLLFFVIFLFPHSYSFPSHTYIPLFQIFSLSVYPNNCFHSSLSSFFLYIFLFALLSLFLYFTLLFSLPSNVFSCACSLLSTSSLVFLKECYRHIHKELSSPLITATSPECDHRTL